MMLQRPFVEETETFSLPVRLKARMNLNFAEDIIKKSVFMISSCTI